MQNYFKICSALLCFSAGTAAADNQKEVSSENILAFSCEFTDTSEGNAILLENNVAGLTLLTKQSLSASSVTEIDENVFEFRFENPALIGYLRIIDGSWAFLSSDAGLVTQYECQNFTQQLRAISDYFGKVLREKSELVSGAANLNNSQAIAHSSAMQKLIAENTKLIEELDFVNSQFSVLKAESEQMLTSIVDATATRIDDLVEKNREQDLVVVGLEQQLLDAKRALKEARKSALSEEKRRRVLEDQIRELRIKVSENVTDWTVYKREFFGRMKEILAGQDGVTILGDRFVLSSEMLFKPASASLSFDGQFEIDKVANILLGIQDSIPASVDWYIRVDGHTDNIPLSGTGQYRDNWELSQARALSVVRYLVEALQFPADRIAANGFGEFRPITDQGTAKGRAKNRRIEITIDEMSK